MTDYWSSRLKEAIWQSQNAPTPDLRRVHLRTAIHYRLLMMICASSHAAKPIGRQMCCDNLLEENHSQNECVGPQPRLGRR